MRKLLTVAFLVALAPIGIAQTGYRPVVQGTKPNSNHYMLGIGSTIRGSAVEASGSLLKAKGEDGVPVYIGSKGCHWGDDSDVNTLYAVRKRACMRIAGYLLGPKNEDAPADGRGRINVWRGTVSGQNEDLLYVNPNIDEKTGYVLFGLLVESEPAK